MEITEQLLADGIAKGLCNAWQAKLTPRADVRRLARLFIEGIDFCIGKDYPTLDFLRDNFKGKSEPYGVWIDDVVRLCDAKEAVLNGDCKGFLEYGGYTVCQLWVRHGSKAAVNVGDFAHLTIDMFDNSEIALAVTGDKAKVFVNLYGFAKCQQVGDWRGCVTIRNTNKKTY